MQNQDLAEIDAFVTGLFDQLDLQLQVIASLTVAVAALAEVAADRPATSAILQQLAGELDQAAAHVVA